MKAQRLVYHTGNTHTPLSEAITLDVLLNNTEVDTNWTAPISPLLRRALWLSLVAMIAGTTTTFFAPVLIENTRSSGLLLEEFLVVWFEGMNALKLPVFFCTWFCIIGAYPFWRRTNGLRSGNRLCHQTAAAVALYGALNAVALGVPIFVLSLNLAVSFVLLIIEIVWAIVQVVFWTIVIITALGTLGRGTARR